MAKKINVAVVKDFLFNHGEKVALGTCAFLALLFGVMGLLRATNAGRPDGSSKTWPEAYRLEIERINASMGKAEEPVLSAKVKDKLGLLASLMERADRVLVGGGMAFTFLHALGHPTGDSILDREHLDECRQLVSSSPALLLPVDIVGAAPGVALAPRPASGADAVIEGSKEEVRVYGQGLPDGWKGLDIGPATSELFREAIAGAGSVFWNGPVGVFEDPRFARGTFEVASAVAATSGLTFVGGGDSAAALDRFGLEGAVDHISTGGGASLELLEHGDLPGLAALRENALRHDRGELGSPNRERS